MSESFIVLDAVYREFEPYIRKLCRIKLESTPDEVDDCVQETFAAFAETLNKGIEIKNPKAWLTRVANNIIKDVYSENSKNRKRNTTLDENLVGNNLSYCIDVDCGFGFDEESVLLYKERILSLLTESERSLICDRYELNKSIKNIAEDRNTTENNIYQKLSRLRIKTKMLVNKVLNEQNA